jgi:hypothetical protein
MRSSREARRVRSCGSWDVRKAPVTDPGSHAAARRRAGIRGLEDPVLLFPFDRPEPRIGPSFVEQRSALGRRCGFERVENITDCLSRADEMQHHIASDGALGRVGDRLGDVISDIARLNRSARLRQGSTISQVIAPAS